MFKILFRMTLFCVLHITALSASAQSGLYSGQDRIFLSPQARKADVFGFELENRMAEIVYNHPALYEWQNKRGAFFVDKKDIDSVPQFRTAVVALQYADGKIIGDYLPYEGNGFRDTEIAAHAIYGTKKYGTVHGSASFSKGRHAGYGWNAIRHADIYLPYIVADSTGGDFGFENYYLAGGYSFKRNHVYYGLGGSFRGEIASRQTDPRCANTTIWLKLDASVALPLKRDYWFATRASYIRNKQHLHLRNWRPNQQDRFFVTYGFGYYDLQESPVSFGIQRMYFVQGAEWQMSVSNLKNRKDNRMTLTANLDYAFWSMKSEESDAKNLFGSHTHYIDGAFWMQTSPASGLQWIAGVQSKNSVRKGKENIYETYRPDENYPSIYDFRKVNTRNRYTGLTSFNLFQGKLSYAEAANSLRLEALAGIGVNYLSERYKEPKHKWEVFALLPLAGLGIGQGLKRFSWEFGSSVVWRMPQSYSYDVSSGEFRIDYQETFLPYAYYTDTSVTFHNQLKISFPYDKSGRQIGLKIHHFIRQGQRPADVIYDGTPSVQSHLLSHPLRETVVKNKEVRGMATLFVTL